MHVKELALTILGEGGRARARGRRRSHASRSAAVFLTCVELGEDKVATLDHRHFSVLRTEDGRALRLLPELDRAGSGLPPPGGGATV